MSNEASEDEGLGDATLFQEPSDYYPPEKQATFTTYTTSSGKALKLRLVGHSPLWGHLLWNAGHVISDYLENDAQHLVKSKDVLELGAGAGLPGLVCYGLGAEKVVITDYPEQDLIDNLRYNVDHCCSAQQTSVAVEGYLWGAPPSPAMSDGFDLLILADLLFNHSEHEKLVKTVVTCLRKEDSSRALVFFTPYRPWLLQKDLAFFDLAKSAGLIIEQIMEKIVDKVLFENDRGDEKLRRTVFGYQLRWPGQNENL